MKPVAIVDVGLLDHGPINFDTTPYGFDNLNSGTTELYTTDQLRAAQIAVLREAIRIVETHKVSVGNSSAGELAAEWTMENLKEVRDELHRMADELEKS